jgi:hypothetical protein
MYWSGGQLHFQAIGGAALAAAGWWGAQAAIIAGKAAMVAKRHANDSRQEPQSADEQEGED